MPDKFAYENISEYEMWFIIAPQYVLNMWSNPAKQMTPVPN